MLSAYTILRTRKLIFVTILFFLFFTPLAQAQLKLPKLNQVKKTLQDATEIAYTTAYFVNATRRTTEEFNKTVKVVKGNGNRGTADNKPVAAGEVTKPKYKKGEFTNFAWEPVAHFDNQLFPSMIISMANYKGSVDGAFMSSIKSSSLGFRFISNKSYIPLKWEVESVDKTYFDKIGGDFMFERAGQEIYFMPDIPWNFATLAKQTSSTPVTIIFRLFDEEGNKVEKSASLFMRSVNDCIYQYRDTKFDFLFTAYIQEQHPEVDKILKEALNTKLIKSVSGYQGDEANTILQVAAVWKVLHDRGFQYSSITTTSTNSTQNLRSQMVRTFDNSLKTNQANCVDGTVVFASILRAINISTVMVLTHDHCFLGFYTSSKKDKIVYLETTMLSQSDIIDKAKTPAEKNQAYVEQFLKAVKVAKLEYDDYKSKNDLTEIDVNYYRNVVRPLPFQ